MELPPPNFYKINENRLATLAKLQNLMRDDRAQLANQGFFYNHNDKCYECAYCFMRMEKFNQRPIKYHTFSMCPKSIENLQGNFVLRKSSFINFKSARKKYVMSCDAMAQNGFYYNGNTENIQCCKCKVVILKLNKNDDIKIIHKIYSPHCGFNRKQQQQQTSLSKLTFTKSFEPHSVLMSNILLTHEHQRQHNQIGTSWENTNVAEVATAPPYSLLYPTLPINVSTLHCENQKEENNNYVVANNMNQCENNTVDIVNNKINNQSGNDATNNNICSNETDSTSDNTCKICLERERQICFLPCGHVATCEKCAKRCNKCCMCRKVIVNKLRIFM
ncbi:Iap-2 [Ectropis obliqua nucleopolyhedrovirus]|nr:Iap-2 [Ectropis obliqua nucleopolyhedrovirus]ABI35737.1 Iap-2 [Ectropis obliqua nucleopolyhedrovirus]